MSLANIITLTRILLTPFLVFSLLQAAQEEYFRYIAASTLFLIGMSDILDGCMAKRRGEVTLLGKYLDPAADKFVVISLSLLFISPFWPGPRLPSWLAMILVGREVFILTGALALSFFFGQWQPCPNLLGKSNNVVQLIMFGLVIIGNVMPFSILVFFWWTAALFTLASWGSYLWQGVSFMSKGVKLERSL